MKNYFIIIFLLFPVILLSNGGVANITALRGVADITNEYNTKKAKLKDELFVIDTLVTYKKTKVQLIFEDETIVTVGKNSHFSINEYLSEGEEIEASFKLLNGAVRVITGKIGKISPQKFKIKTKTATIGIRGTNFIVIASSKKGDLVLCTFGEITVKGKSDKAYVVAKGYMAQVDANGEVRSIQAYSSDDLDIVLDNAFEYRNLVELSFNELIMFFDYIFKKSEENNEQFKDRYEEKIYKKKYKSELILSEPSSNDIAQDSVVSETTDTQFSEIPIEETLTLDLKLNEDLKAENSAVSNTLNTLSQSNKNTEVIKDLFEVPVYIQGDANKVTILDGDSGFVSYHQAVSVLVGSYASNGKFTSDSVMIDLQTGMSLLVNENSINYTSPYIFNASFLLTSYTDSLTSVNYTVKPGSYLKTVPDIDANDEITWGIWNVPFSVDDATAVLNETWQGYFIAGNLTSIGVIDEYVQGSKIATYTGSLIGTAYEFDSNSNIFTTDFNGLVKSDVDFGASSLSTTLSYSVNGNVYEIIMDDSISGNQFNGEYGSGAFYGADGKTLGGQFSLDDSENLRHMTGAYEAKTIKINDL